MTNKDILIRLRYALDIRNTEMVEIFKLGDTELSKEEVIKILTKSKEEELDENEEISNNMLESFLNGFITFKRGKQEPKPGQPERPELSNECINNVLLKKVKIALSLTTDDILEIFLKAGIIVTKGELGALLRKEGHKNYKECGDNFARNFLKGLAVKYRG
ncbi:uncharacterized protein YehS (DUF1456 family) [Bacillus mesophilus]|uniref:DUF1456 family protein n=1 Tax=Bacillus mesophilus TaxID=1808955 RepID=A0A6M0Q877_9BACI|nr:DUF1456 family protein [Bacillus mesophilus]MBM7662162.1 uncharacterized protein YehS (DUF1456 family) [Bacillus mesophilus]NEY72487.1 DUF1456 family protein [Bacillus mesophilus]